MLRVTSNQTSRYKLAGSSLAAIAQELGCTRQAGALALRMGSVRWEQAIAAKLRLPVQALFPDRYDAAGMRLRRTRPVPSREAA
ncbi:helix-turn-helix domain-containing protein [Azospirillum agricola]|uniref:helix-turn-helix domain-containing protein n=1 Tax=Azospirillum agricola TaxID=1720247 RepID=UPI000A1CC2B2